MTTQIDNEMLQHEDAPPVHCEHCDAEMPLDNARDVLTRVYLRPNASTGLYERQYTSELWCADCFFSDAVYIADWRAAGERGLTVTGGYVDETWARDNYYYHERSEDWRTYPEEEEEEDTEDDSCLLNYSTDIFDVLDWPRSVATDALAFGVELEIEGRNGTTSRNLVSLLGGSRGTKTGKAILKYDGSLSDGIGCEIVTLPFTLEQHQAGLWTTLLDSRLQAAAKSGMGTTNCGMHVHINRKALSALTVGKMVVFLNNPDNGGFVSAVAQRQSGSYCQRDSRKKHSDVLHGYDQSRYDIINISGGATVEVRMFRGNLRPERVLKNLEFCHALVRFCESHGISQAQRWGLFANYVASNRKTYSHLYNFLAEKGYFPKMHHAPAPVADA